MSDAPQDRLRVDRWLWFTRFYKTRTLASDAVAGGHVRVNGKRATPGQRVACGDRISLVKKQLPWEVEITRIPARRGPAREAEACYREKDAARARREALGQQLKATAG
ncbi:MAG: RNA-binding S4 domain-containing protein [Woeseiaceae bacterium]|nr:RNA-binding S4 domain-containing protein [Woeseiaceae bacterium]